MVDIGCHFRSQYGLEDILRRIFTQQSIKTEWEFANNFFYDENGLTI